MDIIDFIHDLQKLNIHLWFENNTLHYSVPYAISEKSFSEKLKKYESKIKELYQGISQKDFYRKQIDYWKNRLKDSPDKLELHTDFVRQNDNSREYQSTSVTLTKDIINFNKFNNYDLLDGLMSILVLLIYRYTGDEDFLIGMQIFKKFVANENTNPYEGLFTNRLLFRFQLSNDLSFKQLLDNTHYHLTMLKNNGEVSFDTIRNSIQFKTYDQIHPLYQVLFIYQEVEDNNQVSPLPVDDSYPGCDLVIQFCKNNEGFSLTVHYQVGLFEKNTIKRFLEHYKILASHCFQNPDDSIDQIPFLTQEEKYKIFEEWNNNCLEIDKEKPLHQIFEEQVKKTPNQPAFIYKDDLVTYSELNIQANQLARKLQSLGIGPEVTVGVFLKSSLYTPVALLAILKAGGVYVPLDLSYPKEHISFILKQTEVPVIITTSDLKDNLPDFKANIISLDTDKQDLAQLDRDNVTNQATLNNLTLIMYTSGSTGDPKGVAHEQLQLLNRFTWLWHYYPFQDNEVSCQRTTVNFIPSIWELLGPLLKGVPTVIIPPEVIKDPIQFVMTLSKHKVTRIVVVPSLLKMILNLKLDLKHHLAHLKLCTTCGEALSLKLYNKFLQRLPHVILHNDYGSTEVNGILYFDSRMKKRQLTGVPIGRPIANLRIYVLDKNHNPVPIGVPGQLYVGGVCLARGYYKRPDLTKERFIPNPFQDNTSDRLYNTGDIVRYTNDGMIEYIGRKDQQVKIRGARIELNEIELSLGQHEDVVECAVCVNEKKTGGKYLTAFVVLKEGSRVQKRDLRSFLKKKLPSFMLPSKYHILERMPKLPNGKVDRKLLKSRQFLKEVVNKDDLPSLVRTLDFDPHTIKGTIRGIISGILQESIATSEEDESFIDLGIDSVGIVDFIKILNQKFSLDLSVTTLFDYSTINSLANYMAKKLSKVNSTGNFALNPIGKVEHNNKDIAVIGISGRFPGAENYRKFWDNLVNGVDSSSSMPWSRWDMDSSDWEKIGVQSGYFLSGIDEFEPDFFHLTPKEAEFMDPQQRLCLEECWHTFEDAGYAKKDLLGKKVGVFLGVKKGYYDERLKTSTGQRDAYVLMGSDPAIFAARIAYLLNLKGPCLSIDTACSSSLTALHLACESIRSGESEMALAGGVAVFSTPDFVIMSNKMGMLSRDGKCKTFDSRANGFGIGEAVGLVLLKPLTQSLNDGDHIYGIIKGSGVNQDGRTNGITAPSKESQKSLLASVQKKSGINPGTITLVEAHGTGTELGDPIEVEALKENFSEATKETHFCALGTVKTNIGHTIAAAGISGFIKLLLCLTHKTLVPSLHYVTGNKHIKIEDSPFYINTTTQAWEAEYPRRTCVSSFGFSGSNAHVILEEGPEPVKVKRSPLPREAYYLIPLSARTEFSLFKRCEELYLWLIEHKDKYTLEQIAYTLQEGRTHFKKNRLAFIVDGYDELLELMHTYITKKRIESPSYSKSILSIADEIENIVNKQEDLKDKTILGFSLNQKEQILLLNLLYERGYSIPWRMLYAEKSIPKIPLPVYPFHRERYWFSIAKENQLGTLKEDNSLHPIVNQDFSDSAPGLFLFNKTWKEAKQIPSALCKAIKRGDTLVLFDTDDILYNQYQKIKQELSFHLLIIKPGDRFIINDDENYFINPASLGDYSHLFEYLKKENLFPDKIIINWAKDIYQNTQTGIEFQLNNSLYCLTCLTKAFMSVYSSKPLSLLFIYWNNHNNQPIYKSLSGFAKSMFLENPALTYKILELKDYDPKKVEKDLFIKLISELTMDDYPAEILYHQGIRYKSLFDQMECSDNRKKLFKDDAVYLITGGMGGLGCLFAEYIAQKVKATIILNGRSILDEKKKEHLKRLNHFNSTLHYLKGDICIKREARGLVKKIKDRYHRLDGILHSAGVIQDAYIYRKDTDKIKEVIDPKVFGTVWLDEATKDEPLDFFICFSSIAAVTGNIGQTDYAMANLFMDQYMAYRSQLKQDGHRNGISLSINWPFWRDGGTQLDSKGLSLLKETFGIIPMDRAIGINAFELSLNASSHNIVISYGTSKIINQLNQGRFTESTKEIKHETNLDQKQQDKLRSSMEEYLVRLIANETGYSPERLKVDEQFEKYEFSSITVIDMSDQLEKDFGRSLSKTLFFEYTTIKDLCGYFIENHMEKLIKMFKPEPILENQNNQIDIKTKKSESDIPESINKAEDIAIIGLNGRYPQADNIEEFWDNLAQGRDCITEIPKDRWNYLQYYASDKEQRDKCYAKWGGFINDVDKFDAAFFNISPREAELMDPQSRLFLETVWKTFEDAGYTKDKISGSNIGVFAGVMWGDYQFFGVEEFSKGSITLTESSFASIANRISYYFDLTGPSMAIDTMCSSSLTALHLACDSIRRGECKMAIAGGVNLSLHPYKYFNLSSKGFASTDGKCKSFGKDGDGYVPGEGVGAVLLKPLSKAVQDGNQIYAVIRGTSINHSGKTKGYTAPNPKSQSKVIARALQASGIEPESISYIETHGTGTALGDPIEIKGLEIAFEKSGLQNCAIGSIKSNIGHLEAAAGIAGLTKILLQMKYKQLVPSLHSKELNPNIDFSTSPFYVQQEISFWNKRVISKGGKEIVYPRRACVSSFGAGGSNAHIILEEYEGFVENLDLKEKAQLFIISAMTKEQLQDYIKRFIHHISSVNQKDIQYFQQMIYTLQTGRESFGSRLAIIASNLGELYDRLGSFLQGIKSDYIFYNDVSNLPSSLISIDHDKLFQLFQESQFTEITKLWVSGITIDWHSLYKTQRIQSISLPTYPFFKRTHWYPHSADQKSFFDRTTVGPNRNKTSSKVILRPLSDDYHEVRIKEENINKSDIPKEPSRGNDKLFYQDILKILKNEIALVLHLDEVEVDENLDFLNLGLDSILGVEFISKLNKHYDLNLKGFHNCNNLQELSHFIIKKEGLKNRENYKVPIVNYENQYNTPNTENGSIFDSLKKEISQVLHMNMEEVDKDVDFFDLGLDSILGLEFIENLNKKYNYHLKGLHNCKNLSELSNFIEGNLVKNQAVIEVSL